MKNLMIINGHRAVIEFDPDIEMFRGEFIGLNGGADFYADSAAALKQEGEISLKVFLETCEKKGIKPHRSFSGKFQVRTAEGLHERAVEAAAAKGISLNQLVTKALEKELGQMA